MSGENNDGASAGDNQAGEGGNPAAEGGNAAAGTGAAAAAGAGGEGGGEAPPAKPERPDYVPEKFWDAEAGAPKLEDAFKSYGELERERLERTKRTPEDYALPESFKGFEDQITGEQLKAVKEAARGEGFSQAGFEGLVKALYGDPGASKAALEEEFGDELEPTLDAIRLFAGTLGGKEGEHEEAVRVMCSFPGGIKMLDAWRKASAEGVLPGGPREGSGGRKTEADLRKAMQDPRYWRDRDPDYVAEVTKGWQELHGGQEQTAAINPSGRAA